MKLPRVIIADDHTLLVEALRTLLVRDCDVVGTATNGRSLLESASKLKPDVVVVDVAMPLLNGLEAGQQLKEKMPNVKVIYMTMNHDPDLARRAMEAGASGYLLKQSAASELFFAIKEALKGRSYVTPEIARGMEETFIRNPHPRQQERSITQRQREVIQLLSEGKTMKEAAHILRVSRRTIAFHKYRAMEELGIKSNADLIQFAISNHILVS
jgi:DNA-binding NarL/FixJ family response regulator